MARQPTDPLLGIIPGDPALRRIVVIAWTAIALIGGSVLWYVTRVLRHAQAVAVYDPRGAFLEVQRVVIPAVAVAVIAGVILSAYCLVTALRIHRSGRFPAPRARVLRPTPVRRGAAAQRAAMAMMVISLVMLTVSIGLPFVVRRAMLVVRESDNRFRAVPPPDSGPTPDRTQGGASARRSGINDEG